jgi:DNA (cytosine-5)-methyltransferase 1
VRQPLIRIQIDGLIVDNFAGGGGASTGIEMALGRSPDIAINHSAEALAMHAANHPHTRHLRENVWNVDPEQVCGGKRVALAWFSPDCTHHSRARGGVPFRDPKKSKRSRGLAWVVTRWARAVRPRVIILENVQEFEDWGPIGDDGRADPSQAGRYFRAWWRKLESYGYQVEMRAISACDHGAPTTRRRLFVVARCDGQAIVWPEPTHGEGLLPYRTAAEIIDWSIPCPSIFLTPTRRGRWGCGGRWRTTRCGGSRAGCSATCSTRRSRSSCR